VTGHTDEKSPEAIRKEESRARQAEAGFGTFEVTLGPNEAAMLKELREQRGGAGGAYSIKEYFATSIRRDHALLQQELASVRGRVCGNCRKPLPQGCAGFWGKEGACERAQLDRAIAL